MKDKGQFLVQSEVAHLLNLAQRKVEEMWEECENLSDVQRASAEDTIHFIHEEASEVVKCAMHLGLMGDKTYYRSESARSQTYSWEKLLGEIGDVLLMALTLPIAFDVSASACLSLSLSKFRERAKLGGADGDHVEL